MASAAPATNTGESYGTPGYRAYVLGSLTLIYTLNFVDRILISVVGRPIIEEFNLSNFQFGILTGIGFVLFYTSLGIPIARLSERVSRVRIIGVCVILWSIATILCGFAVGFVTLLLARLAVGVGEAGCTPPANSLISDYFTAATRPMALGIYAMGVMLGGVLAQLGGGAILNLFTWREAFIYIGAPGVLIGIILLMTVKEPPRGYSDPPQTKPAEKATLREAMGQVSRSKTFWYIALGMSLATFGGYGLTSFKSLYIQYTFGLTPGDAAIQYMAPISLSGAIGAPLAGYLIQRFSPRFNLAAVWVPAVGFLLSAPLLALGFLAESLPVMFAAFLLAGVFQYFYIGASYSVVQTVVDQRTRATAIAILLFIINLIGYGGGPPILGALADSISVMRLEALGLGSELTAACSPNDANLSAALQANCLDAKAYGIRWACVVGSAVFLLAGLIYFWASRYYMAEKKL
ncbi:spinster family MFS transporter [Erythrobacter sp. W53]|uniref:spinster family MFS transporter n=1 Tax=Erythrobacter sp. W53 TaxID=3425947 RepID=UPI003D766A07